MKSLSHVRLIATPWSAAYQAPPSMGFSRQEYWSGVPLPSPLYVLWGCKELGTTELLSLSLSGKITGEDCCSFLQRIFPTQGLNPVLLHCRQILYHFSYREVLGRRVWGAETKGHWVPAVCCICWVHVSAESVFLDLSCTVGLQRGGMKLQRGRYQPARHKEGLSDNCLAIVLERQMPHSWVYSGGSGHTLSGRGFSCWGPHHMISIVPHGLCSVMSDSLWPPAL